MQQLIDVGYGGLIVAVFAATYLGMALGRVPGLRLDRAGIALIALALLLVSGAARPGLIAEAADLPTLMLLFALMILSAQFAVAGFYGHAAHRLATADLSPGRLLGLVIATSGALSAVLVNDIVVFSMTPLLCAGLAARGRDVRPYLIGLAAGSNAGSAATLVGNPQNILIGQVGGLDFWQFFGICAVPALVSLVVIHQVIKRVWHKELQAEGTPAPAEAPGPLDRWQLAKGLVATLVLLLLFASPLPRELSALLVAGGLLVSRRLASGIFLAAVDWPLLLLFGCLFTITAAFSGLGYGDAAVAWLGAEGLMPDRLPVMAPLALLISNTVGNVPGVVLIVTAWPEAGQGALVGLALLSTLAGNLLIVGSLANIIVAERAAAAGCTLGFRDFARAGVPTTLITMALACAWLWLLGLMPF